MNLETEKLLSLKRHGDTLKRLRSEQDETRIGFEVDYDRIIFSSYFRSLQDKTQVIPFSKKSLRGSYWSCFCRALSEYQWPNCPQDKGA